MQYSYIEKKDLILEVFTRVLSSSNCLNVYLMTNSVLISLSRMLSILLIRKQSLTSMDWYYYN